MKSDDDEWATNKGLTQAELACLGTIAVQSAELDDWLFHYIVRLTNLPIPIAEAMLDRAMLDAKLTILVKVAEVRLVRRKKRFNELTRLVARIRELNEERTVLIHGTWTTHLLKGNRKRNPVAIKWKRGRAKKLNIKDAQALAVNLRESSDALWEFFFYTWPEKFYK